MWSPIVLCLLVGLAYASNNPAWKSNTEYVYEINGRTFASLNDIGNQYSGILLKAHLRIIPTTSGKLQSQLTDVKYAQVHSHLSEGWNTYIPESDLAYKPLSLSGKPFQMLVEDGIIKDLMVEKEVPNWEANIIKSIASQFQMDTNAKNMVDSKINVLPENGQNNAVFKTVEDTVTGRTETLYEIRPLPEYILQSEPWLLPQQKLIGDGEVIEVVKNKNYSRSEERPSYHYGLDGVKDWEPTANQIGDFFIRTSESRAILSGKLQRYTIQNSYTVDKIIVSPGLYETQKGSVISMLNVTLSDVRSQNDQPQELTNPISLGNLVYTYDMPFASTNEARSKQELLEQHDSDESRSDSGSEESERWNRPDMLRFRRSLQEIQKLRHENSRDSYKRYKNQQPQPQMSHAPESPLLPYTTGYKGKSIKQDGSFDVQQNVRKIAQEIGEELQQPKQILEQSTLSKFVIMSSLIRLMNADELRQTSQALYTQEQQGQKHDSWTTFRDAVAHAGTGPAFLTIQEWIESQKIKEEEAADIVSKMARSVRTPTEEYIKQFFELVHKPQVHTQAVLNSTSLLEFTTLLRQVYVDKKISHNQFPVHSFGTFNTKEGRTFMKETVIPHLTQKLQEAISENDVRKIHLYIRALGNIGHKQILQAFEPYLEGKKQSSQFQRLLMVLAMDKLAVTNPVVARSVLYKIYQNSGESEEVRVAAVYKLMLTSPPTDMLQRMASYTIVDPQEHVNAAVKSSIESLCDLEGKEFTYMSSARAAQPLLTTKKYGKQHGYNYLRDRVVEELNLELKQTVEEIGSTDSFAPKSIRYALRGNFGGFKQQLIDMRALVSSVDQLIEVFSEQTESYKQAKKQKEQQNSSSKFSSENIARQLNLQREEREQLEATLLMEIASLERIWTFDNRSMEQLPQVIRELEESWKQGKKIHYTKINNKDMSLSFPTEMGFPFLFTLDRPSLTHVEGTVKVVANPRISQEDELKTPDTVSAKSDLQMTYSSKVQSHLSFVTPFDHQQYIAGNDQVIQINLPVNAKVDVDVKKMQVKAEFEPKQAESTSQLLHFSQWPYTSRSDIMTIVPVALRPNTQRIREERQHSFDKVIGKQETGMAFRVYGNHPYQSLDILKVGHLLKEYDVVTAVRYMWDKLDMEQTEFNVAYLPEQSSQRKVVIRYGHQSKYIAKPQSEFSQSFETLDDLSKLRSDDPYTRQQAFLNQVSGGIHNFFGRSSDFSVEFTGQKQIKHTLTVTTGKSNVDPKSNVIIYYENNVETKPFRMGLQLKNEIYNTNGLNLEQSLQTEPKQITKAQFAYGRFGESDKKMKADINLERSQERKEYLTQEQLYQQCRKEMQEGNKYLQACERMTVKSNLLDRAAIQFKYENMDNEKLSLLKDMFHALRVYYYPLVQIREEQKSNQNEIDVEIRFVPDLSAFNASVRTMEDETFIQYIEINDWAKQILVPHPVFHLSSRVYGKLFGYEDIYRPTTVIDQTAAKTFDNKTYPISLGEQWTVLMQYVPRQARRDGHRQETVQEQLRRQVDNYAVLVRKSQQNQQQRDLMVIVNTPETQGKDVEIEVEPKQGQASGSNPSATVKVNGQQIKYNDQQAYDEAEGFIQIYALPNGELKIEVGQAFYIIYDGERVKITALSSKLRDSVVGLTGNFDDNKAFELVTPQECVAKDPRKFVESFKLENKQRTSQLSEEQCRQKVTPMYVNVISDQDAGRDEDSDDGDSQRSYMTYQTRYVERNGEICFTLRPMPVCKGQQRRTVTKNVAVHCVQTSNVAKLWKAQIDKGANPDFSHKKETATIEMELPQSCQN